MTDSSSLVPLSHAEVARLLASCELLGSLDERERLRLAALTRVVRQPKEAVLFFQGDAPDALYLVRRGEIRIVHHAADGRELVVNRVGPGAIFGEIALLDGSNRTATAIAAVDTELIRLPRQAFLDHLDRNPATSKAVITLLCSRIRAISARVEEGALLSGRARIARHLLRLADLRGVEVPAGTFISAHLPQAALGASVGLSRQTVNQVLSELSDLGCIDVRRARITVTDRDALEQAARPE